jgi:hypothetical protein
LSPGIPAPIISNTGTFFTAANALVRPNQRSLLLIESRLAVAKSLASIRPGDKTQQRGPVTIEVTLILSLEELTSNTAGAGSNWNPECLYKSSNQL